MDTDQLQLLKSLFPDKPHLVTIINLGDCESERMRDQILNNGELYAEPVHFYMTGRTGAGKTTIGNMLMSSPTNKPIMESTGYMDCTSSLAIVKINNLYYYDTPGAGSSEEYENINRAIFLMPLLDDEEKPETLKINEYKVNGEKVPELSLSISDWQSSHNQQKVAPDVIVFMVAPHRQFLRADRDYAKDILKTCKKLSADNKIVFVLNQFYKEGVLQPTPQNNEDCRKKIQETYEKVYPSQQAPIVEVDALRGNGIQKLTELICKIIPRRKLGEIENVLQDDLKEYAQKERSRRYIQSVIEIATRIALKKVDHQIGDTDIVKLAAQAILTYGLLTYNNQSVEGGEDILKSNADSLKDKRSQNIEIDVPKIKEKDDIEYEVKEEWKEWEEKVPVTVERSKTNISLPVIGGSVSWGGGTKVQWETVKRRQLVQTLVPKKKGVIQVVDGTIKKVVGKDYLKGGYEVFNFLLSVALGVEAYTQRKNSNQTFLEAIEEASKNVESKLNPVKQQLTGLIEKDKKLEQEEEIIQLVKQKLTVS